VAASVRFREPQAFVYGKAWRIGSDLEQHASRLAEVNRAEVLRLAG
jgi:hypothetical protein